MTTVLRRVISVLTVSLLAAVGVGPAAGASPKVNVHKVGTSFDSYWVDADGDGVYHSTEVAPYEGAPVAFELSVAVPGGGTVDGITIDNQPLPASCAALVGVTVKSGLSVTCVWTVDRYAPAAGSTVYSTVTLSTHTGTVVTGNGVTTN